VTAAAEDATPILIVDDQKTLLGEVKKRLAPQFKNITTCDSSTAAVREIVGKRYAVLMLDVLMEPVSGLDLLKLAREKDPYVQVLMMTAYGSLETAIKALQLGALDYVTKPITDWESVVRSVKRAILERTLRIENAALVEQLKSRNADLDRAVKLLRNLNETSETMHASKDVRAVMQILVKAASQYLEARRVSIMIRDPKNDQMAMQIAEGIDGAHMERIKYNPGQGVAGQVIKQRAAIVVDDASRDARVPSRDKSAGEYRSKAFMSIPILLGDERGESKVMGVVNVTDRVVDRPFTDIEVEFVSHLARQAAYALTRAALFTAKKKAPAKAKP
jgi:DNA-binding response OmpR family regulator